VKNPRNAGTNRGAIAPLARRRRIQRALEDLAALKPVVDVCASEPRLLDGDWELLYSTVEPFRCDTSPYELVTCALSTGPVIHQVRRDANAYPLPSCKFLMPKDAFRHMGINLARVQVEPVLLGVSAGARDGQ
jgi:hypothetical protein